MKYILREIFPEGNVGRWMFSGFRHSPVRFSVALVRSFVATNALTGAFFPLRVRIGIDQKVMIKRGKGARAMLTGILFVNSWGGSRASSSITLSDNSHFTLDHDFEIGPDVHFHLGPGAHLQIAGKQESSGSGITCNSRIMAEENIVIGRDCIIGWDVFISDSDWHNIDGVHRTSPVVIGDHVWIAHGVSIVKGAQVPSGCIVGAKSLVSGAFHVEKALIAGVPAKLIRSPVEWER